MHLPLIVGCLVLSACAVTPPVPAAKTAEKAPAKTVQVCDGVQEQPHTGSIMSKRRCRKQEQTQARGEAAQDAEGKADHSGGS